MSIFTFHSEFKKSIEPNIQKIFWADYLKKSCLTGAAYNLVFSIENIEAIWEKLTEVYGNTQLLLQNKIGSLGKFSNLEKMKDDEKITFTLSSILNVMTDLSKLALEYDLEGELYHGGGLQSILELIEKYRERKFIRLMAKENLKSKQKWDKLVDFLKGEFKEREAFILYDKATKCMTLESKPKHENENRKENLKKNWEFDSNNYRNDSNFKSFLFGTYSDQNNTCTCHICGNSRDHIKSKDRMENPSLSM